MKLIYDYEKRNEQEIEFRLQGHATTHWQISYFNLPLSKFLIVGNCLLKAAIQEENLKDA